MTARPPRAIPGGGPHAAEPHVKLVVYFDDEQHLVRRLGAAVMSCWGELSPAARYLLFRRSIAVCDDHETERLEEQLRRFFAAHARVTSIGSTASGI